MEDLSLLEADAEFPPGASQQYMDICNLFRPPPKARTRRLHSYDYSPIKHGGGSVALAPLGTQTPPLLSLLDEVAGLEEISRYDDEKVSEFSLRSKAPEPARKLLSDFNSVPRAAGLYTSGRSSSLPISKKGAYAGSATGTARSSGKEARSKSLDIGSDTTGSFVGAATARIPGTAPELGEIAKAGSSTKLQPMTDTTPATSQAQSDAALKKTKDSNEKT